MTPYHSWFLTYEPCQIPIRMPHNKVVYAVKISSVGFKLVLSTKSDPIYKLYLAGKMNANPFPPSDDAVIHILQHVYSDVHQLNTRTQDGYKYWITFIEAKTKFYVVYLLKHKSDAFTAFKDYKAYAENITGQCMGEFQMDKGGKYISKAFLAFLREHGIVAQMTIRNRHQQNGVVECANCALEKHTTSMLEQAGLPDSFSGEVVGAYVHVCNMIPTSANLKTTPFELWHKKKPEVSNLHIWGCNAYVHVQKDKQTGIHSHIQQCIFLGYPPDYAGWKFYNPVTRKIVILERAEFDECYLPALKWKVELPILPVVGSPPLNPVLDSELDEVIDLGGGLEPIY
jgi:hypothetical protein